VESDVLARKLEVRFQWQTGRNLLLRADTKFELRPKQQRRSTFETNRHAIGRYMFIWIRIFY
jgi:hypothetical protein